MTPQEKLIALESEVNVLEELIAAYQKRVHDKKNEMQLLVLHGEASGVRVVPYVDPLDPDGNFPVDLEVDCG